MDDHRVDAGPFELLHLVLGRERELGDGELARRYLGEELQHLVERPGEYEQLRVEAGECVLELLLIRHTPRHLELPEVDSVLDHLSHPDVDDAGIGAREPVDLLAVPEEEDRQMGCAADVHEPALEPAVDE